MRITLVAFCCLMLAALHLPAHVIQELYAEVSQKEDALQVDFLLDAMDEIDRGNQDSDPPSRDWLDALSPAQHAALRVGSAEYITAFLKATDEEGAPLAYSVSFPDYDKTPPDFPETQTGIATVTVRLKIVMPEKSGVVLQMAAADLPDLAIKVLGEGEDRYVTLSPGAKGQLFDRSVSTDGKATKEITSSAKSPQFFFLEQGFEHVIPAGWDHILFMVALALLTLEWRKLLGQSLLFTAAHSLTLGLSVVGFIKLPVGFVEAVIALSIVWMAAENLWAKKIKPTRLILIGVFGLIHGMGFAFVLGNTIRDSGSFYQALFFTNLGVELAQVCVILLLWLIFKLFIPKKYHPQAQKTISLLIVIGAGILFVSRVV